MHMIGRNKGRLVSSFLLPRPTDRMSYVRPCITITLTFLLRLVKRQGYQLLYKT